MVSESNDVLMNFYREKKELQGEFFYNDIAWMETNYRGKSLMNIEIVFFLDRMSNFHFDILIS